MYCWFYIWCYNIHGCEPHNVIWRWIKLYLYICLANVQCAPLNICYYFCEWNIPLKWKQFPCGWATRSRSASSQFWPQFLSELSFKRQRRFAWCRLSPWLVWAEEHVPALLRVPYWMRLMSILPFFLTSQNLWNWNYDTREAFWFPVEGFNMFLSHISAKYSLKWIFISYLKLLIDCVSTIISGREFQIIIICFMFFS